MTVQLSYTKIFMTQLNIPLTESNIIGCRRTWWKNTLPKFEGGLRLTDKGLEVIRDQLGVTVYEIPLPLELDMKPQVYVHLDQLLNCPYHLTEKYITVTSEKKCLELYLFSNDVQKYGLTKAKQRDYNKIAVNSVIKG